MDYDPASSLLDDILRGRALPARVTEAEMSDGWAPELWDDLVSSGLPWVSVPEARGGSGGTLAQALALLRGIGKHAAPVPFAESGILGGWLLASVGLEVPKGPVTVAMNGAEESIELTSTGGQWRIRGRAERVPWASCSGQLLMILACRGKAYVVAVPARDVRIEPHRNIAGEPRDTVFFDDVNIDSSRVQEAPPNVTPLLLRRRGALCRAHQMVGAMERMVELSLNYAQERIQFGRPIYKFQAVSHHLVAIAGEAEMADLALACLRQDLSDTPAEFVAAMAKSVAGDAAEVVAERSHQVHGAMGAAMDYALQLFSRRVWAWEAEFGNTGYWRRRVIPPGTGAEPLWRYVSLSPSRTDGSPEGACA